MWVLITIIKLPGTVLAGTEAVTILRSLVDSFSQILGAFCHLAGLGCYGDGNSVYVGDSSWNHDFAQEKLGSKVKAGPGNACIIIKCLLSTYYVPGPVMGTGNTGEFPSHWEELVIK